MAYFMNGTRLAGLEREMMLPPNFKPRGHGRMVLNRFRYKPEDVDCKLCTEYRHRRCTQPSCPWLAERIESGVVCYQPLVLECFRELESHPLMARVRDVIRGEEGIRFEGDRHRERLSFWRSWLTTRNKGKAVDHLELAVLFLLTARESIWNKLQPHLTEALGKWDASIHVRGLSTQDYALLQTIKSICTGQAKITVSELADEELVDDDTLRLIIDAALLCRYGQAALFIREGARR